MVDIKSLSNNEIIYSTEYNEGCQWNKSLMGEDYITLKFSSDVLLSFHLGDYVETEFGWYELSDLQKPVMIMHSVLMLIIVSGAIRFFFITGKA